MTTKEKDKNKRTFTGVVVSDKMDKTAVVKVDRTYTESRLHKIMKRAKKYKVHDEKNEAKIGDVVEFHEGRPKAKTKYMYLSQVIKSK